MNIHNLTPEEKELARAQYYQADAPYTIGFSLGEFNCNQRCRICPMYTEVPQKRLMPKDVFLRACESVGNRKCGIEISAYGETFQHPAANEYLFQARKKCPNADIIVATNGTFLDEECCEKIVDSGIDTLQFSLDAGSPESHKWLTGANHYDKLVRNLETLIEVREKRNGNHLKIYTHIIGIKELAHEFDEFVARWAPKLDLAHVRAYGNWAGMVDDNGVTPAEKQELPKERYPCAWLWYASKIEPDGNVSKCFIHVTGDDSPLGNIMNQSLEEIWTDNVINNARKLHCSNDYNQLQYCDKCTVWSLFPNFWDKDLSNNKDARWI